MPWRRPRHRRPRCLPDTTASWNGPGAHGRRSDTATQRHKKPENYLSAVARSGHGLVEERALPRTEQAAEALMMGLRLGEGIDLTALSERFGIAPARLIDGDRARMHENLGFLSCSSDILRLTDKGMVVLDSLLGDIVGADLIDAA